MAGKEKKSSGNGLIFKNAEKAKSAIMESQQKEIRDLYEKWADEIGEKAKYYSHKSNASASVSERYYKELQKQLRQTSHEVSNEIYRKIKSNMYTISDAVIKDNVEWLSSFGFSKEGLNAAFSYVPNDVVQRLVTGQIYESGWSLSSRIWGDNERTLKDIYQVMAKGISEQKPIYEIAKDLEAYVRPSARLPWNLRMNDGKKIYKKQVDYNAQRLARTLTQHSYQQSFIAATEKNPFVKEYIWISNGSRVCDLCKQRDGMHFKKGELPMDHPNGMCTMEPVVNNEEMKNQLVDWFNSPDGTYPEIDEFASNFGYKASKSGTIKDFIDKYGMSSKSPSAWYSSLTQVQKAEAKALKEASGLTWKSWYQEYIYTGEKERKEIIKNVYLAREKSYVDKVGKEMISDYVKTKIQREIKQIAFDYNSTEENVEKQINETLKAIIDNSDFTMRIRGNVLTQVLKDGRFKNQFETGTSGGALNQSLRRKIEHEMFNVPSRNSKKMTNADRPVYGMLCPKYDGSKKIKDYYNNGPGSWYGDGVTVVLKKNNIINQATMTIGDSLDYRGALVGMQANNPEYTGSFSNSTVMEKLFSLDNKSEEEVRGAMLSIASNSDRYFEYQLHGEKSHSAENIEKVFITNREHFGKDAKNYFFDLIEELEKRHIPYEFI